MEVSRGKCLKKKEGDDRDVDRMARRGGVWVTVKRRIYMHACMRRLSSIFMNPGGSQKRGGGGWIRLIMCRKLFI